MTRASRFSGAMQAYTSGPDFDVSHILDNYDWASLGAAQVVDIGGAQAHIAIALAQRFEDLHILVQDMGMIIEGAEHNVPAELKERVRFEAHDLFAPQTATADVVYLR
jgi:tRNA1(Val) A37 N6-methylase TrmN6